MASVSRKKRLIERAAQHMKEGGTVHEARALDGPDAQGPESLRSEDASAAAETRQPVRTVRRDAELNLNKLRMSGLVVVDDTETRQKEEFRLIKRPLLRNAFAPRTEGSRPPQVIMVTSAVPREGKTFVAISLAMSIAAEPEHHVLLVDADMKDGGLGRQLHIDNSPGLADLLAGESLDMADVLVRTNVPNLTVLPSGRYRPDLPDLLASTGTQRFIDQVAARSPGGIVVIDTPPVLARSEAAILASLVGQTVMVVEAERTSRDAVAQAFELINECPNCYVLLNKVQGFGSGDRYGDYYDAYSK